MPPRLGSLATWQHREPFPQSNEEKTDYVDLGVNGRSSSRKIVLIRKELERARWKVNREVQGMSGVQ